MNNKIYDTDNVFYKLFICNDATSKDKIIYQNSDWIVIEDINKKSRYHFLIISKYKIISWSEYIRASKDLDLSLRCIYLYLEDTYNLDSYKVIINNGKSNGQEIMHLHIHVVAV